MVLLAVDLGARLCGDQVSQALGERGVSLVTTTTAFAGNAV